MFHQELATGRWFTFSLIEQLAHTGSEVSRAVSWSKKSNREHMLQAIDRALELLDLTIADRRWRWRLKELTRLREVLCDRFYGDNEYNTSDDFLQKYFMVYAMALRRNC